MTDQTAPVVTLNAGSSSIKFAVYDNDQKLAHGAIERIGLDNPIYWAEQTGHERVTENVNVLSPHEAIDLLLNKLRAAEVQATVFGHRIVHGGKSFTEATVITDSVLDELASLTDLDPEHMPAELLLIRRFREAYPDAQHVACFDTAFHHAMPLVAQLLPIPRKYYELGIRRYGFHGLSYQYLLAELQKIDNDEAMGRVVVAHLGSGASLAAIHHGQPIDTTMGFTPAGGIPMSSRSGDIDPNVATYLMRNHDVSLDELTTLFNQRSGLLGVSETSADMKKLIDDAEHDNRAADAVELFCYQVRKSIASLAAAMGGIDTLVFSGGMAEASSIIRERVCRDLAFIGIVIDQASNDAHAAVISTPESPVRVRVIPTDESSTIARQAHDLLMKNQTEGGEYGIS